MKKNNPLTLHIADAVIFTVCYMISLFVNWLLGFGKISFGNFVIYSIVFCLLEVIKILFLDKKFRFVFFFANIYFGYCITSLYFIVVNKASIKSNLFTIDISKYLILLGISTLLSFLGYGILIVRHYRLSRRE
ncbi:hypothetical protein [Treponema zioleckii]|uniref:hypothetical protein n=1 Tax=Treponema zioleckii TaxID=331680 RepID=UPI00168A5F44|nr:hypothetical protein [Treponema zioleckii]